MTKENKKNVHYLMGYLESIKLMRNVLDVELEDVLKQINELKEVSKEEK